MTCPLQWWVPTQQLLQQGKFAGNSRSPVQWSTIRLLHHVSCSSSAVPHGVASTVRGVMARSWRHGASTCCAGHSVAAAAIDKHRLRSRGIHRVAGVTERWSSNGSLSRPMYFKGKMFRHSVCKAHKCLHAVLLSTRRSDRDTAAGGLNEDAACRWHDGYGVPRRVPLSKREPLSLSFLGWWASAGIGWRQTFSAQACCPWQGTLYS
jgi:hypothetical protein